MTVKHVYLGRFAPFQKGHVRLLSKLIEMYGPENVLVLVGSTNTLNKRTPYTYEDRKEIIKTSFPDVEVVPLPDGKANLEYFDGSTNDIWLDSLEKLAKERGEEFVFYGGSKKDLEVQAERFKTVVLVDRYSTGEGLSATVVRELILKGDKEKLVSMVDPKALDLIIERFKTL